MQFDSIDEILDWTTYKKRLKADLQRVKSGKIKFTYYEKFKFGDNKVRPLLLIGKPKNKGVLKEIEEKKPQKMSRGVCFRAKEESGEVIRFLATKGTPDEADVQKAVMWSGLSDRVKVGQGTEADEAEAERAESEEADGAPPAPSPDSSKSPPPESSSAPTPPPPGTSVKSDDIPTAPPPPETKGNAPAPPPLPPAGGAAKSNKVQGPATAESAAFTARLAAVVDDVKRAAGRPEGQTIKLKVSESGYFARKNDFARANALLDEAIALLKGEPEGPSPQEEWESRWGALEPKYLNVVSKNPPTASKMRVVMGFATDQAAAGNFEKALAALKQLDALVTAATPKDEPTPGPTASSGKVDSDDDDGDEAEGDESDEEPSDGDPLGKAMAGWVRARAGVVASLNELSAAIKGMDHPKAKEATILLRGIRANLTPKPDSLNSVKSLQQYLNNDSIIDEAEASNGFGIRVEIKDPLLEALEKLKPLVPA